MHPCCRYGTTKNGDADSSCDGGCGTVFELAPNSEKWTERVLHSFSQNGKDGTLPYESELVPNNGKWTYKVLHSFSGKDGSHPYRLILDAAGNLHGSARQQSKLLQWKWLRSRFRADIAQRQVDGESVIQLHGQTGWG